MNPDGIAALLALPTPVREALAKCAGPGWYVRDGHEAVGALRYGGGMANPGAWAWCPADTAAILDVAATLANAEYVAGRGQNGRCWAYVARGTSMLEVVRDCASARLAALRLLARVSA